MCPGGAATSAVATIVPPPPSATARGALHFEAVGILKSVFVFNQLVILPRPSTLKTIDGHGPGHFSFAKRKVVIHLYGELLSPHEKQTAAGRGKPRACKAGPPCAGGRISKHSSCLNGSGTCPVLLLGPRAASNSSPAAYSSQHNFLDNYRSIGYDGKMRMEAGQAAPWVSTPSPRSKKGLMIPNLPGGVPGNQVDSVTPPFRAAPAGLMPGAASAALSRNFLDTTLASWVPMTWRYYAFQATKWTKLRTS
jgi:hypothetical protein